MGSTSLIELTAQLEHGRLADPALSEGLNEFTDLAPGNASDPCFLDHGDLRLRYAVLAVLLGGLRGSRKLGKYDPVRSLRSHELLAGDDGVVQTDSDTLVAGHARVVQAGVLVAFELVYGVVHERGVEHVQAHQQLEVGNG